MSEKNTRATNPFTLTFGRKPQSYIFRYEDTEEVISSFMMEPPTYQVYLISGVRGSGKTVLMTAISKELEEQEWITVDINPNKDLLEEFAERLSDACHRLPNLMEKGFNVSVAGVGIGIGASNEKRDAVSRIEELLDILVKKNKKVLITLDEVRNDDNMRIFASQFQALIRKDYPICMIMTGLYENIYAIQNDPALTFLLRAPKTFLKPLSIREIMASYKSIFEIDMDEARQMAALTKGYAFAYQALGYLMWKHKDKMEFDEILFKFDTILFESVYQKIWESLSDKDREVMIALSHKGEVKVSEFMDFIGMNVGNFSRYRDRLKNKGLIISQRRGTMEMALPRFDEFIDEVEFNR